jgi:hypothetical protein
MCCRAQGREALVEMAETDLHSVLYFKLGLMANASTHAGQLEDSSIAGGSSMCRETWTLKPGPSSVRAIEMGFGKQSGCGRAKEFRP